MSSNLLIAYYEMISSQCGQKSPPKCMYFSSTKQALYVMHEAWNTAPYFEVSVIRGDQIKGHDIQVFELGVEPYTGMENTLAIFNKFMKLHINNMDCEELIYKSSMSTRL